MATRPVRPFLWAALAACFALALGFGVIVSAFRHDETRPGLFGVALAVVAGLVGVGVVAWMEPGPVIELGGDDARSKVLDTRSEPPVLRRLVGRLGAIGVSVCALVLIGVVSRWAGGEEGAGEVWFGLKLAFGTFMAGSGILIAAFLVRDWRRLS